MSKQQRNIHQAETGHSKLLPPPLRQSYADLIDCMSIRADALNFAAMDFMFLQTFASLLKERLSRNEMPKGMPLISLPGEDKAWQIYEKFFESQGRGELLFCLRDEEGKKEFAVIARFASDPQNRISQSAAKLQAVGDDAFQVLERFLNNERRVLQLFKENYEREIGQRFFEKFIDEDCKSIFEAVVAPNFKHPQPEAEMLKRKGELCQHKVPGFPGLLTTTEYRAYIDALASLKDELLSYKIEKTTFPITEKIIPHWEILAAELIANEIPKSLQSITRRDDGEKWEVYEMFLKPDSEVLFCSRYERSEREFAVLERFNVNESLTVFGDEHIHAIGKDASRVLEEFLRGERASLQSSRDGLEQEIEWTLSGKLLPGECARVFKAIMPLYDERKLVENENAATRVAANAPAEKNSENVKGRRIC